MKQIAENEGLIILMCVYRWLVDHAVILGLFLDFVALIVTIFLTVGIYKLERRHEKERILAEERGKEIARIEAAKVFLIDNDEEIEYLTLAEIAKKLNLKRKHCRNLITRYLRCDKQLQAEILRQANVPDFEISMDKVGGALGKLQIDMERCGFGINILYDGGKYLHRAIERWANSPVDNVNPYVFEDLENSEYHCAGPGISWRFSDKQTTLFSYMWDYLHAEKLGLDKNEIMPPVDMLFSKYEFGNCHESIVTFWTMRMIIDACHSIKEAEYEKCEEIIDESLIQTQEDMYYYTLAVLCETYSVEGEKE